MENREDQNCQVHMKNPKRILHFSDGTLEEYSDSDEETAQENGNSNSTPLDVVDYSKLTWGPWLMHKVLRTGTVTLSACDYVGEALASFLGITTPKYQYELDEYRRLQKEQQKSMEELENAKSWTNGNTVLVQSESDANNINSTPNTGNNSSI